MNRLTLNWIGSTSQEVSVIAVRTDTGVKTLDDVKTREVVVAGPAPGTDGVTFPTTLNNLLGTKFKVVTGYRSGAEMTLAVERKEVDGRGSWSWASFRNDGMTMLKRGELTLLVQMATAKSPDIPQVPLVMDYAKTDEQRQVLELLLAGQAMAWPVFAPAEVPQDRVALLRKSYLAMLKDAETLADAKKLGVDVAPVPGEAITDMLKRIYATPAGGDREGARARRPKVGRSIPCDDVPRLRRWPRRRRSLDCRPSTRGGISMLRARLKVSIAAFGAVLVLQSAAAAQDFYAGKTVTICSGHSPGSLYDTNARFVARHLPRFVPGNPSVIVRNMPGAGTLTASNHVANLAPKDGTALALVARGVAIEPLLGGQGVRFDPLKLHWIGSTSQEVSVIAVRADTGVKTLDDAKTREVVRRRRPAPTASPSRTRSTTCSARSFEVITGYRSGAEMALAIERKEVDGRGSGRGRRSATTACRWSSAASS